MLMPKFLYGLNKDVKKETKKFVTKLIKDVNSFNIPNEEMTEIDVNKHRIALGVSVWHGEYFHPYWIFEETINRTKGDSNIVYPCVREALKRDWATLCLFGGFASGTQFIFKNKDNLFSFLTSANKYWYEYLRLGNIFSDLRPELYNIWNVESNIKNVLALLGVPNERLMEKAIPNDLIELVEFYKQEKKSE